MMYSAMHKSDKKHILGDHTLRFHTAYKKHPRTHPSKSGQSSDEVMGPLLDQELAEVYACKLERAARNKEELKALLYFQIILQHFGG